MHYSGVNKYSYSPYGVVDGRLELQPQPFTYVGQFGVFDEGNGVYYMRARYYDANAKRFISEDPEGFGGGDTNLYAYVSGNPIMGVDPNGQVAWFATAFIGAGAGAIGNTFSQYVHNGGFNNFSWTELGIATVTGAAAGAAAPFVAAAAAGNAIVAYAGTAMLGAYANVVQTIATSAVNGEGVSTGQLAWSAVVGAASGGIAGPAGSTVALNVGITNLFRNMAGGLVSNAFGSEATDAGVVGAGNSVGINVPNAIGSSNK